MIRILEYAIPGYYSGITRGGAGLTAALTHAGSSLSNLGGRHAHGGTQRTTAGRGVRMRTRGGAAGVPWIQSSTAAQVQDRPRLQVSTNLSAPQRAAL